MTFSGGIIDLTLFGILQGNAKTNWIWIVIVGLIYAVVYYFVFYFMITKLGLKTPGREADGEETKLYTRKDVNERKAGAAAAEGVPDMVSALILEGLGGKANISDIDCCATRLRVTLENPDAADEALLKQSGASGVVKKGNGIQVIYGPQVSVIKSHLEDFMDTPESDNTYKLLAKHSDEQSDDNKKNNSPVSAKGEIDLAAYADGIAVPLSEVKDEAFAGEILGKGAAIIPENGKLYSPCSGTVENIFGTKHAVNILSDDGAEILLHIGVDTVKLGGKYFEAHVKNGSRVKKGDLLISFDLDGIKSEGYDTDIPMIICNSEAYENVIPVQNGKVRAGSGFLKLFGKGRAEQ